MPKLSAGILLVRIDRQAPGHGGAQVLLVHPGGPYWKHRDLGSWSIPKGEYAPGEDAEAAARREFTEELGLPCPQGVLLPLGSLRQPGGKLVTAWCAVGSIDTSTIRSNTFEMIWPPRSERMETFPEIDRAEFFARSEAELRILPGQRRLIETAFAELGAAGLL